MKKVLMTLLITICLCSFLGRVSATAVSFKKLDNIYYNLTVDGNYSSGGSMFYLDGHLAYCIEPGVKINSYDYNLSNSWSVSSLTDEQQALIEKIGYYGYEYPGHQTEKYYIAAQELIWKTVKDVDVYWTTEKYGNGDMVDISSEKQDILNLISRYDSGPSFASSTISGLVSSEMVLEDTNNVLADYTISSSNVNDVKIDGNKLYVSFSDEAVSEKITLSMNKYDSETLIIYTNSDSQSLATLRLSKDKEIVLNLVSYEEETETPETVKVPSTDSHDDINHFLNKRITVYNDKKFTD